MGKVDDYLDVQLSLLLVITVYAVLGSHYTSLT